MKLPKIKTLNHQIDVIEANSTATEARLAKMERLLERIGGAAREERWLARGNNVPQAPTPSAEGWILA